MWLALEGAYLDKSAYEVWSRVRLMCTNMECGEKLAQDFFKLKQIADQVSGF